MNSRDISKFDGIQIISTYVSFYLGDGVCKLSVPRTPQLQHVAVVCTYPFREVGGRREPQRRSHSGPEPAKRRRNAAATHSPGERTDGRGCSKPLVPWGTLSQSPSASVTERRLSRNTPQMVVQVKKEKRDRMLCITHYLLVLLGKLSLFIFYHIVIKSKQVNYENNVMR